MAVARNEEQQQQPPDAPLPITLFVYVATEDGSPLTIDTAAVAAALERGLPSGAARPAARGRAPPFGRWSLYLTAGGEGGRPPPVRVSYWGQEAPHTHNLTQAVKDAMLQHFYAQARLNAGQRGGRAQAATRCRRPGPCHPAPARRRPRALRRSRPAPAAPAAPFIHPPL